MPKQQGIRDRYPAAKQKTHGLAVRFPEEAWKRMATEAEKREQPVAGPPREYVLAQEQKAVCR